MEQFKDLFEAKRVKKIKHTDLPKMIGKSEQYSSYSKTEGEYEYTVIEPDEFGDYGDEGEKYNQGETFRIEYTLTKEGKIKVEAEILDLSRKIHNNVSKKYNKEYDSVEAFTKAMEQFFKDFTKASA